MSASEQLYEIQIDYDVTIRMRDGTQLSADIYRPQGDGKWPVLVSRDAYDQSNFYKKEQATFFSRHGYVYINSSVRGRYLSQGDFSPMHPDAWNEQSDSYDVIEWAAQQPWSDGAVGMFGISYAA